MKYLTLEDFIKAQTEEDLWKMINEYEKLYLFEDAPDTLYSGGILKSIVVQRVFVQ